MTIFDFAWDDEAQDLGVWVADGDTPVCVEAALCDEDATMIGEYVLAGACELAPADGVIVLGLGRPLRRRSAGRVGLPRRARGEQGPDDRQRPRRRRRALAGVAMTPRHEPPFSPLEKQINAMLYDDDPTDGIVQTHCECGKARADARADGTKPVCAWEGSIWRTVVVETMPRFLRASHGRAVPPLNGAVRLRCAWLCAKALVVSDPDWTSIIEGNWRHVDVWSYRGRNKAEKLARGSSEQLAALREYRDTAGIVDCYLVDPADYPDDADLTAHGPAASAIDWTGLS